MAATCSCSTTRAVAPAAAVARPQGLRSFNGLRAAAPLRAVRAAPVAAARSSFTVQAAAAAPEQKIRIKLKAYHTELLEDAVTQIKEAVYSSGAALAGPVPLPTRKRVYCVLKSPHVNKTAREHFEIRTHSRLLDIKNITAQTVDALLLLDLPAGVDVQVKL